jgi:hypothetical protein
LGSRGPELSEEWGSCSVFGTQAAGSNTTLPAQLTNSGQTPLDITTWGQNNKKLFLQNVARRRMDYPKLASNRKWLGLPICAFPGKNYYHAASEESCIQRIGSRAK